MSDPTIKTKVTVDPTTGHLIWNRVQDVEPILEDNKRAISEVSQTGNFRKLASIPNIIIEKWIKEEGLNIFDMHKDPSVRRKILRKLHDPEYKYLRTLEGTYL